MKRLSLSVAVCVFVFVANAQNVGVGTAAPAAKLHVQKGASNGSVLSTSTIAAESNSTNWIHLLNPEANDAGIISGTNKTNLRSGIVFDADSAIRFRAGGNFARMYIGSAGNVGINTTAPAPSAALQVNSTTKGFLMPRMTTAQRKAIVDPEPGLLVFDMDKACLFLWDGVYWNPMVSTSVNNIPPIERHSSDGATGDYFGGSVSISGDFAIVGAYDDNVNGRPNQGSAYIFVRSGGTWVEKQKLLATDGEANDNFGRSVFISGDIAIVGASSDDVNGNIDQGSAYIFIRSGTTWTQQQKLVATSGTAYDYFGNSVGLSGNYAIVGASNDFVNGTSARGSAYIFYRSGNTWTQQQKLLASDGTSGDWFGESVSISGDYAIMGAPGGGNIGQGAAYIFNRSGSIWTQQQKLVSSTGLNGDRFGKSVSIWGDYIIIGAPGHNLERGVAHIYVQSGITWIQQQKIQPSSLEGSEFFGFSVCISGDNVVIHAEGDVVGGISGKSLAYIFQRNGTSWNKLRLVTNEPHNPTSQIERLVGISGFNIIIGISYPDRDKVVFLNFE
ncbi:MAG: hypothetical protein EOO13_16395 [Chitinophagaceae bacterium]|nr:MAG: hypothetical protein EOO13_16395 [Chitinophagaceae bacterium]